MLYVNRANGISADNRNLALYVLGRVPPDPELTMLTLSSVPSAQPYCVRNPTRFPNAHGQTRMLPTCAYVALNSVPGPCGRVLFSVALSNTLTILRQLLTKFIPWR